MKNYLYNDSSVQDLTQQIEALILSAKHYIKISSFLVQDYSIVKLLKQRALSGEIAVFVISNRRDKDDFNILEQTVGNSNNKQENLDTQNAFLQELFYSGVHVHLLGNLHAKFIIADGDKGILMSANITPTSLRKNLETGICLSDNEVKDIEHIFDVMYANADIVKFSNNGRTNQTVISRTKISPKNFESFTSNIRLTACSSINTNLSECNVHSIYDEILNIINNAKKYLYIVSWHFKLKNGELTELIKTIDNALRRNVKIITYSNVASVEENSLPYNTLKFLHNKGIKIYGDDNNHSKCVISETQGIIFTANIDCFDGLTNGFEVGCVLSEEQRLSTLVHIKKLLIDKKCRKWTPKYCQNK